MPTKTDLPLSSKLINRMLVLLVVFLAILAGYFHAKYSNLERINSRLLAKYQVALQLADDLELALSELSTKSAETK